MSAYRDGQQSSRRNWPLGLLPQLNLPLWKRRPWLLGYRGAGLVWTPWRVVAVLIIPAVVGFYAGLHWGFR